MIRNFYNSTVGRLSKTFEFSKIGELEKLKKFKQARFDQSVQVSPNCLDDILASLSQNVSSKSFISLAKCLELLQKQHGKLLARRKELGDKIEAVIANSSEDIKNTKIVEENYNPFKSMNAFSEREECKQKFKQYLEKARLILACKKDTTQAVNAVLKDVELLESQIREFEYLQENVRLSLESFVAPELQRRKEFEQLNKELAQLQWNLVTKENEAREKFIETADLQNLPYAIKKILVEFVEEEDVSAASEKEPQANSTDLKQLM